MTSMSFVDVFNWLEALVLRAGSFLVTFITSPSILNDYIKLGVVLAVTILLEIAARKNWRVRYGSRNFRVDMLYFVFYYGGFYHLLALDVDVQAAHRPGEHLCALAADESAGRAADPGADIWS